MSMKNLFCIAKCGRRFKAKCCRSVAEILAGAIPAKTME
jgi:hypothetical protein